MTSRKLYQSSADSKSLWNFTLSPGWSSEDCDVLRRALIHYGCGNWKNISLHFPCKTMGQLNLQTQRLFGQQSVAEFLRLHLDPKYIKPRNDAKTVALRKNGCVVNTGDNMTPAQKKEAIARNRHLEVPREIYENVHVPIVYDSYVAPVTRAEKIARLEDLCDCNEKLKVQQSAVQQNAASMSALDSDSKFVAAAFSSFSSGKSSKKTGESGKETRKRKHSEMVADDCGDVTDTETASLSAAVKRARIS